MNSIHSEIRAQQRGIPPLVTDLLDRFGQAQYDGHGGLIRFFNNKSVRRMEKAMGREPVRCLSQWLDAYKVVSVSDGETITIGHRHQRIFRR
jgi:hypothetical protein